MHGLYMPRTAHLCPALTPYPGAGSGGAAQHTCVLMPGLITASKQWVLGIQRSLPPLLPSHGGHTQQALPHQQNAATCRPCFCPGGPCENPTPRVSGRTGHPGTLCLALTRIPEPQESKCSAEPLCFSKQSRHREPFSSGGERVEAPRTWRLPDPRQGLASPTGLSKDSGLRLFSHI